jgi:hypothetical protein
LVNSKKIRGLSINKAFARRNMGCDMASIAEAASPLTGGKFRNYHAAHVQRSASCQIIAEGNHINDVLNTSLVEGIQVKEIF